MTAGEAEAAGLIWDAWQEGRRFDALPGALAPDTRQAGYAIQAQLEGYSTAPRAGWKIAATSEAGQAHINVDGPLAGRLLAEKIVEDGARVSIGPNAMRVAEPEFAFRFGGPLGPRGTPWTVTEVMDRVETLHLAIELPDSRFTDFTAVGAPSLIADNACARDLVLGPAIGANWRALDLSAHEVLAKVGTRYTREGVGANVLGDPRKALAWCVNEVTALGIGIAPGEVITTGTCAVPCEIAPGDRVVMDFGMLGRIGVSLTG